MRTYIVYCEPCGFKKIVQDPQNTGLRESGTTTIQGRIPMLVDGKTQTYDPVKLMPKFKCPDCGRMILLKKYNVPTEPKPDEAKDCTQPDTIP